MKMKKITFYTPTYNRAYLLPRLYESLKNQTNKNFIWLVVDDGSTDGTKALVEGWENEGVIEILYEFKENGGKHTAMDFAHQHCQTEFSCCVDSDDYLSNDATEIILDKIKLIEDKNDVVGIVARRYTKGGVPFAPQWPKEEFLYFYMLADKYHYLSETVLIFKNNIIKNYHFPIYKDEKFITESVLYNQFLFDYKIFAFDAFIYICKYLDDGYTSQGIKLFLKNPKGFMYSLAQNADFAIKHKRKFKHKIFCVAYYYSWQKILKIKSDYKTQIPLFYKICGKLALLLIHSKNKKVYQQFLQKSEGKR